MDAHKEIVGKYDGDEPEEDALNEHWTDPGDPDGVIAAEERRKWEASNAAPTPTLNKKSRWPVVVLVLALIVAAASAAYWLGTRSASAPASKKQASAAQAQPKGQSNSAKVPTQHYDSTIYTLGIDYPNNWVISDTAAKLTITSPEFAMTSLSGATQGSVVVTIQNQQTSLPSYPGSGTTASLDSTKLTYKQPTSIQRAQTYLSFIGYQNPNGINALYLTGDNGYQVGQQVPVSDIVKGNPLVSVIFVKCSKSFCTGGSSTPVTLQASSWKKASFNQPVVNLLQSLTLN